MSPEITPVPDLELGAFAARLELRRPPLVPEIELWLVGDEVDLETGCEELGEGEAPPFWAFCWGSGQALARFLLDHPERVAGQCVVDLGTGSGIVALAAARAGADRVIAVDLDRQARLAALSNARHNGLHIEACAEPPSQWDLLLAADVLYETGLRDWVLGPARERGPILLADPGRTGTPEIDFPAFEQIAACTFPDVDSPRTGVTLHEVPALTAGPTTNPNRVARR